MFLFKTLLVLAISNFVGSNYSHIDPNLSEHSKANSQSCNHDHIQERSESDCFCYDELSNDVNYRICNDHLESTDSINQGKYYITRECTCCAGIV